MEEKVLDQRISKDNYYMGMAILASLRSTCARRHVGSVLVVSDSIVCEGYNGAPRGITHCTKDTCLRIKLNIPSGERHEICRAVHAEQNVIAEAAKLGISAQGGTLYVTDSPCIICAKLIINSGIKEIVYGKEYPDSTSFELLKEAGIILRYLPIKESALEILERLITEFSNRS